MAGSAKPQWFSATIYTVGINRCVDVPENISKTFEGQRYVPVVATVKGHSSRTTLVPGGRGRYRLFLNDEVREAAGVDTGHRVRIRLSIDRESRDIPIPKDVAKALRSTKEAQASFEALTPAQRRGFLQWVLNAKKQETRERRIEKGIAIVLETAERKGKRKGFTT